MDSVIYPTQFGRVLAPYLVGGSPDHPGLLVSPVAPLLGYEQHNPRVGEGTRLSIRLPLMTYAVSTYALSSFTAAFERDKLGHVPHFTLVL